MGGDQRVRIVCYNILSSHLASPSHFKSCDPEHLAAETRLSKIQAKLEAEINASTSISATSNSDVAIGGISGGVNSDSSTESLSFLPKPIFCLQENTQIWDGPLRVFFAKHNYSLMTSLYGSKYNNYMGIAIAYPLDTYELIDAHVERLSDCRPGGWPRPPKEVKPVKSPDIVTTIVRSAFDILSTMLFNPAKAILAPRLSGSSSESKYPPIEPWDFSEKRYNTILFVRLRDKTNTDNSNSNAKPFCVANYHMPCTWYAPKVMTLHSEMIFRRSQDLAGSDPLVLAGDFNIIPDTPTYKMLTQGTLSKDDTVNYPDPKHGMEWTPTHTKMDSAYAVANGQEPNFTNYAKPRDDPVFIETLDYIFLSSNHDWRVHSVKPLPHRDDVKGPLPNADEPSDHIMISAILELL